MKHLTFFFAFISLSIISHAQIVYQKPVVTFNTASIEPATKQYIVTRIIEQKGRNLTLAAVNMNNAADTATLYYGWKGGLTNKTSIKEGTTLTWYAKPQGRMKQQLFVNPAHE